jgi:hypothetical protein
MEILTLPEGFMASIISYIGDLFRDLSPLVMLILGLFFGVWIVGRIIKIFFIGGGEEVDFSEEEEEDLEE